MNSTAKAPEGILERIRKCLALGDKTKGATEAEAETAIKMAKMLMAQHGLKMSDVEFKKEKEDGVKTATDKSSRKTKEAWELHLARVMDTLFTVQHYVTSRVREDDQVVDAMAFIGLGEDSNVAAEAYTILLKVIRRMASESGAEHGSEWHGPRREYNGRERNSYCLGVVYTLSRRADEKVEGLKPKEEARLNEMVVVKDEIILAFKKENLKLTPLRSRSFGVDDEARARGEVDGEGVNLNFANQLK